MTSMLNEVVEVFGNNNSFIILTHINPDHDAVASCLAFEALTRKYGKKSLILMDMPLTGLLSKIKGAERICYDFNMISANSVDIIVTLDCAEETRVGALQGWRDFGKTVVNIDHHASNGMFGDINLVDGSASSTGEVLWSALRSTNFSINEEIATYLYISIVSDTGFFKFENTTEKTFLYASELVKLGAKPWHIARMLASGYGIERLNLLKKALDNITIYNNGSLAVMFIAENMMLETGTNRSDTEFFVEYPRGLDGVKVGALVREERKGLYSVSLRSNSEVDVSAVAGFFGGGGHMKASAFRLEGSLDELMEKLISKCAEIVSPK